jgi:RNA polymerase sigma-70 factor, ECF subfamily
MNPIKFCDLLQVGARAHMTEPQRVALDDKWSNIAFDLINQTEQFAARMSAMMIERPSGIGLMIARLSDLWLAHRAGLGDSAAVSQFDAQYLRRVPEFLAHLRLSSADIADVQQQLLRNLCASDGERIPLLWQYSGRADIAGWLRVVAVREGLQLKRRDQASVQRHQRAAAEEIGLSDPLVNALKTKYRDEFRKAFAVAMQQLDPKARSMLRLQVVEQLTLDEIGRALRVHAATASRWLSQARSDLHRLTCAQLATQLQLADDDVDSAMRLIASELDASVSRVLGAS